MPISIHIDKREYWNNDKNEFVYLDEQDLLFEHSLLSLTHWEEKYRRPFLSRGPKDLEESIDYFKFMCLTKDPDPLAFAMMSTENYCKLSNYIDDIPTATTFTLRNDPYKKKGKSGRRDPMTSEVIYYYMSTFNIPYSCETWNLNKLLTLIEVGNYMTEKANGGGKMSKRGTMQYYADLNERNKALFHTKG